MELRHIRYFLAVAEEGNFTRAAARLGISQPPLSQQIHDLEGEVGTPLFHRVPHGAELTEAGKVFLAAVRAMPEQAADAIRDARRAARGERGVLRVGFTATAALNPLVPRLLRTFRRRYPDVELILNESNSIGLIAALRRGETEIALLRPAAIDGKDLHGEPLTDEEMIIALPAAHPLARTGGDGSLPLASLREEPFVFTPRTIGPSFYQAMLDACREAGFTPHLGQAAPQMVTMLALVAAEQGVAIAPASMRQLALEGVVYRTIRDVRPLARLSIVHRRETLPVLVRNFLTTARSARSGAPG